MDEQTTTGRLSLLMATKPPSYTRDSHRQTSGHDHRKDLNTHVERKEVARSTDIAIPRGRGQQVMDQGHQDVA